MKSPLQRIQDLSLLAKPDKGTAYTYMKSPWVLFVLLNRKRFLIPLRTLENDRLVDTENKDGAGSAGVRVGAKPAIVCTARWSYPENERLLRGFDLFFTCEGVGSPMEDLDVNPVEMVRRDPDDVVRAWRLVAVMALSRIELYAAWLGVGDGAVIIPSLSASFDSTSSNASSVTPPPN